jgi:glycolate oxidase
MLMIESDAGGSAAEAELVGAGQACLSAGATSVVRARDPQEADWLREARRQAHPALERAGVARMDDVGVPRNRIPEMLAAIERISAAQGLKVGVFGHAGDGNLHPTYVVDRDDPTAEARIDAARGEIYRAALALGGTVTGEHGIGVLKRRWLAAELDPAAHDLQRRLRTTFDPAGTLTPGRAL